MRDNVAIFVGALLVCCSPSASWATETITYEYDVRGRLIRETRAGAVNGGLAAEYTIDQAGNRNRAVTTGSANLGLSGGGSFGVVVVPLNGFTVIPFRQ